VHFTQIDNFGSGSGPSVTQGTTPWVIGEMPTASSSFAITPESSSVIEASHILKASAGNLYSLYVL